MKFLAFLFLFVFVNVSFAQNQIPAVKPAQLIPGTVNPPPQVEGQREAPPRPDYYQTSFNPPAANKRLGEWRVTQTEWSAQDEIDFGQFVTAIYQSGCKTVDQCIKSRANIYLLPEEQEVFYYADCGRFPFLLRMYFAWKRGLPFSVVVSKMAKQEDVEAWLQKQLTLNIVDADPKNMSLLYTPNGNIMRRRFDVPSADLKVKRYDFYQIAKYLFWRIDTANYRFDSDRPLDPTISEVLPDFYPTKISTSSIRSGTVYYDPAGHVLVVAQVSSRGDIFFFDAHPDNSISRPMFGEKHERGRPAMGPGFKNYRPFRVENPIYATLKTGERVITNGTMVVSENQQIQEFSIEQMVGSLPDPDGIWQKGKFLFNEMQVEFREWVKLNVATDLKKIDPIIEFKTELDAICIDLKTRRDDVETGLKLANIPHPDFLPANIHSGHIAIPDWEPLSTPGRDRRARLAISSLMQTLRNYDTRIKAKSLLMDYHGTNLWGDLYEAAKEVNQSCELGYTNTRGNFVKLTLFEAMRRIQRMSFDPYHCVELRWGAWTPRELASCPQDPVKQDWYKAQQIFRNKLDTNPIFDLQFTLQELQEKYAPYKGYEINLDLERFLKK